MDNTEIVELTLPGGAALLVRADRIEGDAGGPSDSDTGGPSDIGLREALSFSHVSAAVRGLAAELHEALQAARPNSMTVELGLDFAVKGSHVLALVADAETRASIRVQLEWHDRGTPPVVASKPPPTS
jgi:hypothetical protein